MHGKKGGENMKKIVTVITSSIVALFLTVVPTFAHVVVRPNEVGVGARTNFLVSVPTEEDVPTTQIRLVVPKELQSVRPNVKPGWTIELVKTDEGEEARVSEIIWSGGSIPAEQRDEFVFSAQAPAEETSLTWKAYQTYADGTLVSWDKDPKAVEEYIKNNPPKEGEHNENTPNPFSVTKVTNDLAASDTTTVRSSTKDGLAGNVPMLTTLSGAAVALSVIAIFMAMKKR